jgi:hypothetical protein
VLGEQAMLVKSDKSRLHKQLARGNPLTPNYSPKKAHNCPHTKKLQSISKSVIMGNITLGRPPKPIQKRKRLHYSVWVNEVEKKIIDQLASQSGLPVSQFFLTQIIDKPIKTQRKKFWPKSIEPYALAINKISGMLSLLAIKTKDRDMQQSRNWIESSEHIKWLSKLIMLRVFEDFDFPNLKNTLSNIETQSKELYWKIEVNNDFQAKIELLKLASKVNTESKELLDSFEKHYIEENTPNHFLEFWSNEIDIHQEIKKIKTELLKL